MKLSHGYIEVITLFCVYYILEFSYNKFYIIKSQKKKKQMKVWIREWDNQVCNKIYYYLKYTF